MLVISAALTVVAWIAERFRIADGISSRKDSFLFASMLLMEFAICECFFISRFVQYREILFIIGTTGSFFVMLLSLWLYERLSAALKRQREQENEGRFIDRKTEMETVYREMLRQQHDLRHRIEAVEQILAVEDIDEEISKKVKSLLNSKDIREMFCTGSMAVDAVLRNKLAVMNNAGICFKFREYPLLPLPVSEDRLCLLLSNLLDNAIEGVMQLSPASTKRNIELCFFKSWDMLFIDCINDMDETQLKKKGNVFLSTKSNPEMHGYGIPSMQRIVNEEKGDIRFETEHGQFIVHIMLPGGDPDPAYMLPMYKQ